VPKIRTIPQKDGSNHYRFTVDAGRDPDTGEAPADHPHVPEAAGGEGGAGQDRPRDPHRTYVKPWDGTVNELLDAYLRSATFGREANTAESYKQALRPVRERLGHRRAQSIGRQDIEDLRDWLLASGRRRGGKPGWTEEIRQLLERHSAALCWADRLGHPGDIAVAHGRLGLPPVPRRGGPALAAIRRAALRSWVQRVAETWPGDADIFVYFNNDQGGAAVHYTAAFAAIAGGR